MLWTYQIYFLLLLILKTSNFPPEYITTELKIHIYKSFCTSLVSFWQIRYMIRQCADRYVSGYSSFRMRKKVYFFLGTVYRLASETSITFNPKYFKNAVQYWKPDIKALTQIHEEYSLSLLQQKCWRCLSHVLLPTKLLKMRWKDFSL